MDKDMEMLSVLGKIAAALSRSAGHTVEVYKAEESTPPFRVYLTTTEEGDHAVVLVHGTKVTVLPFTVRKNSLSSLLCGGMVQSHNRSMDRNSYVQSHSLYD